MARVCNAFCSFLAMALSVAEMATKPRPSSERPTMTIRLTSSADPRLSRRFRRERLTFFIVSPQSQPVGLLVLLLCPRRLQCLVTPCSVVMVYSMQSLVSRCAVGWMALVTSHGEFPEQLLPA